VKSARPDVLPSAADKPRAVEEMFDRIAPRYDLLNRVLTLRMDVGWRRTAVSELRLDPGAVVLDLACGTGDLCRELTRQSLTPIGVDFSAGMLSHVRGRASFVRGDALVLPFPDHSVWGIVSGFALRNFAALDPFLSECARVLRRGGRVALLDVAEPGSPQVRALHGVWFRKVVPFIGGIVSDRSAYEYLPASTTYLPTPAELALAIARAGFDQVEQRTLGFGAAQLLTGTRR
jgi:demethylmenaquinone methyltransferase/2-methoxy-6-polyprenyl-1,4-benzoquinol methylase